RPLLMASMACQAMMPAVIYGASWIASRFSNYTTGQIPAMVGIRTVGNIFQASPLRILSSLTRQRAAFHALKRGYLTAPLFPFGRWREEQVDELNKRISADMFGRALEQTLAQAENLKDAREIGHIEALALVAAALENRVT